jgi:hypothetical protein
MINFFSNANFIDNKNNQILNDSNKNNNFDIDSKRKLENKTYFNLSNKPKSFKFSPPTQFLKNRIIENLSDSNHSKMNNIPLFDVKQVMKINSEKNNLAQMNLEYINSININNRKNSFDPNLFKQNYYNYGMLNNNHNNIQYYQNMNNHINLNLMKKHFENMNINSEININDNFSKDE